MDDQDPGQALYDTAEREHDEAAWLKMLADADEQAPQTVTIASQDRVIAMELEMEAEYLRKEAAERKA
jgi:hypothetical protein